VGEGGEDEISAREALRGLVGAARAWLELHRDAGSFGLPGAAEFPALAEDEGPQPLAAVVSIAPLIARAEPAEATPAAPSGEPAAAFGKPAATFGDPAASFDDPAPPTPAPAPIAAPSGVVAREPPARPVAASTSQSSLFSAGIDGAALRPGLPLGVEVPADPEARMVRLQVLAGEASGCTRCRLHTGRTKSVFARGNPKARIMFVGEGPGADEDAQGLPFVGKAGQLLDRMVAAMGLQQEEIYIGNVVKCRPPQNRKPEPDEMASCMPYLAEQIALIEPEVIIALGGTAAEGLLGGRIAITRARGQWRLYRATIPVMPTYHPAYLLRNPPAKREVWVDLRAVLQRLGRQVPGKGA
jgi:uracil-DNA glycosylase